MRFSKPIFAASFFLTLLAAPFARAQDAPPPRNFDAGGRVRFGASLVGMQSPGRSVFEPMAGVGIELRYQTTHLAIVADARAARSSDGLTDREVWMTGLGARYFFSAGGVSPYIGGGLAYSSIWIASGTPAGILIDERNAPFSGTANGLGAYGEIGVEMLRTRHAHIHIALRLDAPFYSVPRNWLVVENDQRIYAAPLSLAFGFTI